LNDTKLLTKHAQNLQNNAPLDAEVNSEAYSYNRLYFERLKNLDCLTFQA